MRLNAFQIKNFRSIVDTELQSISPDNITCLIGQNESGKTSILEGLKVFYSGIINEDVLRSDMSIPCVSCRFDVEEGYLKDKLQAVNDNFDKLAASLRQVTLVRSWKADLKPEMSISGELLEYINRIGKERRDKLKEIECSLELAKNEISDTVGKKNSADKMLQDLEAKLFDVPGKAGSLKLFRKRIEDKTDIIDVGTTELRKNIDEKRKEIESLEVYLSEKADISAVIESWKDKCEKKERILDRLDEISVHLEERHQRMTLLSGSSINELSNGEWERVLEEYADFSIEKEKVEKEIEYDLFVCGFLLEGMEDNNARQKVESLTTEYQSEYTARELGELIFDDCPQFEIFEDFGSLLPNRIDLEDMLSNSKIVEGYKAARNFLTIAELDYSFFQQSSSRILKQKIENLNTRLTREFQDFWQQYVGRQNKIRISFELDHYSTKHGDKAGQPYLEFWVKDEGERLYPKQRSRGVRWFLSFYLELMAASKREKKQIVLLVDEPGVSLHARAQEDVLKVFEDIKENIQVIYTTHSPHLVDINKLHRVLAVQRDDIKNHRSATTVLDAARLTDASPDTLSPLQSIMGNPVGNQEFSVDKYNIIVNDVGSFYMMNAVMLLMGYKDDIHFIPSTDAFSIPLMCNILMGWGMKYAVQLFHNDDELEIANVLKKMVFSGKSGQEDRIILMPERFPNAEDILSTLDFKKRILKTREGIIMRNSEYVTEKDLPRNFLLSKFLSDVRSGKIKRDDLDEETCENLTLLVNILQKYH